MNEYPIASFMAALKGDIKNAGMTSDDIILSEKAGQTDLILSTKLPRDGDWDLLKEWGLTIIDEACDLFYNAVLPIGWTKRSTDHNLHSELVDDKGRRRAGIFYKAAFYDQRATISPIKNRFYVSQNYGEDYSKDTIRFDVRDAALDSLIYKGVEGQYAFYTQSPRQLGFVLGDRFHFDTYGKYSEAKFTKSFEASMGTKLSRDDFYAKYHHVKPVNDFISAADNKAKEGAQDFLENFLKDRNQWDS